MKAFKTIVVLVVSSMCFASCTEEAKEILASSVSLNETSVNMPIGQMIQLSATVLPENTTDKTIQWSSSDNTVASVKDGIVSALKVGQTSIKAACGNKYAMCLVNVTPIKIEEITLDIKDITLKAGETATLTATVKPDEATDKTVTWDTSDASVATVSNGVVTAVQVGTATITAKAGDKTATCSVTVAVTPVTRVILDKTSASLEAGETVALTATVDPDNATDKAVTWSTSDATVATVNNGVVTAVKVGTATITAKAGDKTAICTITVVVTPVTSVVLDRTSASLRAGDAMTLTVTVSPDNATDKAVTWSTSDATVATVDNGVVTAVKVGTATITVKAGDKTAACSVTVTPTASGNHEGTSEED